MSRRTGEQVTLSPEDAMAELKTYEEMIKAEGNFVHNKPLELPPTFMFMGQDSQMVFSILYCLFLQASTKHFQSMLNREVTVPLLGARVTWENSHEV